MKERVYTLTLTEQELILLMVVIDLAKDQPTGDYSEETMQEADKFVEKFVPMLAVTLAMTK